MYAWKPSKYVFVSLGNINIIITITSRFLKKELLTWTKLDIFNKNSCIDLEDLITFRGTHKGWEFKNYRKLLKYEDPKVFCLRWYGNLIGF